MSTRGSCPRPPLPYAGFVRDNYGTPISGVELSLAENNCVTQSLSDGSYSFNNLSPGSYTIIATRYPYAQCMVAGCTAAAGSAAEYDVTLQIDTANVLLNGGFENGFNNGLGVDWSIYTSNGYSCASSAGTDFRKAGACSQKLQLPIPVNDGHAGLCQVVQVIPGNSYTIIAWERDHLTDSDANASDNLVCRLGYHPTGGINCCSSTVVWQDFDAARDTWNSIFESVVPTSQSMTIFLEGWRKTSQGVDDCCAWFDAVSVNGPSTAPSVPIVHVQGSYLNPSQQIQVNWSSPDTDVASYEYAISATADKSGILPGAGWVSAGLSTSAVTPVPSLANGSVVWALVCARNATGVYSAVGISEPIRIVTDVDSIASAKLIPDGTWVRVTNVCATRMGVGPDCFIESQNRTAGIETQGTWSGIPFLEPGTITSTVGQLATQNSVRELVNAEVMPSAVYTAMAPLGLANRAVGGASTAHGRAHLWWARSGARLVREGRTTSAFWLPCGGG